MGIKNTIMENDNKLKKAKKRVEDLKNFYMHLMSYIIVNGCITVAIVVGLMSNGKTLLEALSNFGTISVWLFWGIGLLFHALYVFGNPLLFTKKWEEKQIQKFMEKDREEYQNFKR